MPVVSVRANTRSAIGGHHHHHHHHQVQVPGVKSSCLHDALPSTAVLRTGQYSQAEGLIPLSAATLSLVFQMDSSSSSAVRMRDRATDVSSPVVGSVLARGSNRSSFRTLMLSGGARCRTSGVRPRLSNTGHEEYDRDSTVASNASKRFRHQPGDFAVYRTKGRRILC